ncbi:COPII-coated vesicle protein [Boletus edulis]|uniref:COPII-coated vesicle protein n=1 Tax=Boletus edulis BED1 TaxID=1328754 RepID=A0AAD4GL51_BOLED|nr:COPII-coated vesicle protein [Boletus edulis]KAF8450757.1 COPII-coated vesicle protein [Boletus edulis BED1]
MSRRHFAFFCVALLALSPALVWAHKIRIPASTKECFFEDLHENDQMTVTYQVGEGGHLDIDFWLTDPDGTVLTKHNRYSTGSTSITAENDGRFEYCFSNQMSTMADKEVSFNVHGIIYISEDEDIVAPVEREVRSLSIGLLTVKDEQEYIVVREKRHRDTAESTNDRVKWWSVMQAVVLFSVVAWQVYYLKSFFEVKRII